MYCRPRQLLLSITWIEKVKLMPVSTQLVRGGQPVRMHGGWNPWHLSCLFDAMVDENPEADEKQITYFPNTYLCSSPGVYTFKEKHEFEDPKRKLKLTVMPGDEYHAWR